MTKTRSTEDELKQQWVASHNQLIERLKQVSPANHDEACQAAAAQARSNGILPREDRYGELKYTIQQGLKASCHGREDSAATLLLQLKLLQRLDRNRDLMVSALLLLCCIAILMLYVAFRIS